MKDNLLAYGTDILTYLSRVTKNSPVVIPAKAGISILIGFGDFFVTRLNLKQNKTTL